MPRSKYPEECPAFEVARTVPLLAKKGFHFEGAPFSNVLSGGDWAYPYPIVSADPAGECWAVDELRPLTRAAREMLELVKP